MEKKEKQLEVFNPTFKVRFFVPRFCQGQIIENAYALDLYDEVILLRQVDRSEYPYPRPRYYMRELSWEELGILEKWDPMTAHDTPPIDDDGWVEIELGDPLY